jgi:hypothetical protein
MIFGVMVGKNEGHYSSAAFILRMMKVHLTVLDTLSAMSGRLKAYGIEIEGLDGTPSEPAGSVPAACQQLTVENYAIRKKWYAEIVTSSHNPLKISTLGPGIRDLYVCALVAIMGIYSFMEMRQTKQ